MTITSNGYALAMDTTVKTVQVAEVLAEKFDYWINFASKQLYKHFNREGDASDLTTDVWMSFNKKAQNGNQKGFAVDDREAENMIASTIMKYAMKPDYVPVLRDLNKVKAVHKDMDVTMCSFEACMETENMSDTFSMDLVYAKEFATKWDMMCDDGELTIPQKIDAIKRVTPHYEAATQAGKLQIIEALRATLDLGPDSPVELQDAFKELLMGNC